MIIFLFNIYMLAIPSICDCPNLAKRKKYFCPCPTDNGVEKNANFFAGNTNFPGFAVTNTFILSAQIRTSRFRTGATTALFANTPAATSFLKTCGNKSWTAAAPKLNNFGRWEGAPGGSGSPPTNRF